MRAARVHHAARRRGGGVAARGAGAAARADAAHRRAPARSRGRSGIAGPPRGVPARACSNWAGPRPQRADRHRWATANAADIRKHAAELAALAPDVILAHGGTSPWGRCCRRPAPCRSCSRSSPIRSAPASSTAWRGRAATPPVSCMFEYGMSGKWLELLKQIAPGVTRAAVLRDPALTLRDRPVRRHPGRGAVARGGGEPGQRARRRRDRARRHGLRALPNGGLIVTASGVGDRSSRSDHHAGGPAQTARGLSRTSLRHRRRPDLLRA